ncbi:hypothetical protein Q9295_13880 [Xinfangfangia sp. CPCC 101601]|uniref:DoxX family protein n=1 Tax=Pseudogemmobacter lacusdianii TaxID=3069608 RepID=A0ABU0W0D6_9RHOB|nr:hypothetical protein [Xinfangfangia sp. CPCC 101601]MDQ2067464.1 hypothetical protein [Xinfangfangia sp. CPCC 101601]
MNKNITFDLSLGTLGKVILHFFRLYLGGWMIISGTSYWLTQAGAAPIFPQPVGNMPLSSQMLVTMIEVGLFDIVKTLEIVCGVLLMLNRMMPLAIVLALPISGVVWYNAIVLNLRTDRLFSPTYMGVMCFYMSIVLAFGYLRHFAPLFTWKSRIGHVSEVKTIFEAMRRDETVDPR